MDNELSASEDPLPVWDRLRQRLADMSAALDRKKDPEARARKLEERADLLRRQARTGASTEAPLHFLAFAKGKERYGIPLEHVLEVQALEEFSPVPRAPAFVRGVVHWRGAILALLDLSWLFEADESGLSDLHAYVVVEAAGRRLAVAASIVEEILTTSREQVKLVPELPRRIAPEWLIGVHDETRLLLKMDEICKHLEQPSTR